MDTLPHSQFSDFYPSYLSQHTNINCRRLHFLGNCAVLITTIYILIYQDWQLVLLLPIIGYGCAWSGHFLFEKNQPASLKHPWLSFIADWVMFRDILLGNIKI